LSGSCLDNARLAGIFFASRWLQRRHFAQMMYSGGLAVPMMSSEAVADAAQYRTQRGGDRSQHGGRTESRPRIGGSGQDKGKRNSTNDGNRPRAHDRPPGRAVNGLTRKVPQSSIERVPQSARWPAAT